MSKFRLRQHTGTTRTVIPTPASLNPYQETGEEKAATSEGRLCVKTGEMPAGGALVPASGEHGVVASENGGARKQ
jgi:hypothetical protein